MQDEHTHSDESLSLSQRVVIEELCSVYERQWQAGAHPRIEDFQAQVAEPLHAALLKALLAVEVELRQAAGEPCQIDEYLARFPDDQATVAVSWEIAANRLSAGADRGHTVDVSPVDGSNVGGNSRSDVQALQPSIPEVIGRYKVLRVLGEGGFGCVYLAHDSQLQRDVALKVPGRRRLASAANLAAFLHEARTAARLKHPALVTVYDIQQDGDDVYIVQEFVDGLNLAQWACTANPSCERIVRMLMEVIEAVGFAHQHDLVHRDLKPANLLVDRQGHVHVADFGLALNESVQRLRKGEVSGTPAYMSPEQVRGLTHVLDGRSDLWSIGVILYELLTGRRPFGGTNTAETFEEVKRRDPKPPRMIKPQIPAELERIGLKCLAKRQTDRYASAAELLEDLEAWLRQSSVGLDSRRSTEDQAPDVSKTATSRNSPTIGSTLMPSDTKSDHHIGRIVPKGLRSFNEHDADFFLDLLPGARDRDGLPESIRFWKLHIEQTDPERTFRIGLIYGPSGCGKSSLVKAGLLPHLAPHVVSVYLEATAEDTELRLLKALRRHFADIPDELALAEVLAGIREGSWVPADVKICFVLDQFEQWLHARQGELDTPLVQALHHCDGARLQCIVLVRDDFWMSVTEFLHELEVRCVEGHNAAAVSLFDERHARKVLAEFGKAYRCLPADTDPLTPEQNAFLKKAVAGLAQDGKINCVRLALFAEMLKDKPWTAATLAQVGGTSGLGATFLEETFSVSTAPAAHRHHELAAQAVLKALLPEPGCDIKGGRQSYEALLGISGYAQRPHQFADLIQILDSEIRLITPTAAQEDGEAGTTSYSPASPVPSGLASSTSHVRYYQLTHDYLVPSLRDWLTRKQRATRKGRAALRLAERSALWTAKPEVRHLPSLFEYINIRLLTKRQDWSEPQHRMMQRARHLHGWRVLGAALLVLAIAWGGYESYGRFQAQSLLMADPASLPVALERLSPWQWWSRQYLRRMVERPTQDGSERRAQLHARLARATLTGEYDAELAGALYDCSIPYLHVVRDVLRPHGHLMAPSLWDTLHDVGQPAERRFRAGVVLATYAQESPQWSDEDYTLLAEQLLNENTIHQPQLWQDLRPLDQQLIPPLTKLFGQEGLSQDRQRGAAHALAEFTGTDGASLARLLSTASAAQYKILFPRLLQCPIEPARNTLMDMVATGPAEDLPQRGRVALGQQRAGAAITLLRLGDIGGSHDAFRIQDDPESLTQFVHRCRDRGVPIQELVQSLYQATEVHSRFALLLTMGDYAPQDIEPSQRDALIKQLVALYRHDPSSAIHGAAGWLLRTWGFPQEVVHVDRTSLPYDDAEKREWFVLEIPPQPGNDSEPTAGPSGATEVAQPSTFLTFVVFPGEKFLMGTPESEVDRESSEQRHWVTLSQPLAVSTSEITWAQYDAKDGGQLHHEMERMAGRKLLDDDPVLGVTWLDAVDYCQWLTRRAGWSEAEQCYDNVRVKQTEAENPPSSWSLHLGRRGFRLLTEAEWESMCRSGMRTAYSFGGDPKLLGNYGWCIGSSGKWPSAAGKLRPTPRGLFDVHGNLYEWCHDWYAAYPAGDSVDPTGAPTGDLRVARGGAFSYPAWTCRSADRFKAAPDSVSIDLGFRIAFVPSHQ